MRVLVVDDSEVDFFLIERALGDQFTLCHATTLAGGCERASGDKFDLLILDLTLGETRGYETFEQARLSLPHIPILILSGIDDDELALRAVSNGAQDFIRKARLMDCPLDRIARFAVERRRFQDAAHEAERLAHAAVNALGGHIAILDEAGTIIAVNAAWARFARENGMPTAGCGAGANYLAACDGCTGTDREFGAAAAAGIRAVLQGREHRFQAEYPCHSPGEQRWFVMQATRFEGDGPTRLVVSHENITSRIVAEQLASEQRGLREAVAGMEHVLGVVGHELRTPLAALRAISEFLVTDGARDTAQADQFLHEISLEVDRMSDTVNNILEATRLNSGRAMWNWCEFDVAEVVNDAASSIEPLIDAERVRLEVKIGASTDSMLGDGEAVRRLLINLLSNAQKHTTDGCIEVSAAARFDGDVHWVDFAVRDTGGGIPPNLVSRLGEAFALNSGVVGSNHVSGTGLGLAICKGIAAAHGGALRIDSTPGKGTTVTAELRVDLEVAATGETASGGNLEEVSL